MKHQDTDATQQANVQEMKNYAMPGGLSRRKKISPWTIVGGVIISFVLIIGCFFFIAQINQPDLSPIPISAKALRAVSSISETEFEIVGAGQVLHPLSPLRTKNSLPPIQTGENGKPLFFYHGAEYCPFCAPQRWAMVVALSQFGAFKNIHQITSSEGYVVSFSFENSEYSSPYFDLVAIEKSQDPSKQEVALNAQQKHLLAVYDAPPYVPAEFQGQIPFIDIANRYVQAGSSFDYQTLQNYSWQDITNKLSDPKSALAQRIIGSANYMIAALCTVTNEQPFSVCHRSVTIRIQQSLGE